MARDGQAISNFRRACHSHGAGSAGMQVASDGLMENMSWFHRSSWVLCSKDGSAVPVREAEQVKGKLQRRCQDSGDSKGSYMHQMELAQERGASASGHRIELAGLSEWTLDFEQCWS